MLRDWIGAALTLLACSVFASCNDRPLVSTAPPRGGGGPPQRLHLTRVDKVDLLLVVDNSVSMADKQVELARRVPELVARLTDDAPDRSTGRPTNAVDVHIGVISSSLGSHGSSVCAVALTNAANDDKGHLLPRAGATSCPEAVEASVLTWVFVPTRDPSAKFKGTDGALTLGTTASCVVQSVGEAGCGQEETWEAAYHFLVDPAPYASAEVKCGVGLDGGDACGNNDIIVEGVDEALLTQRAAFLRQDSLVAVVLLSDENDVSLRPAGKNWLPWAYPAKAMQRGWDACESVPDDLEPDSSLELTSKGCFSCFQDNKNPNCLRSWAMDRLNNDPDGRNLRGFHQVQRFGFNFLWSRDRYVNAFKSAVVPGSDGRMGPNPLFVGGFRDQSLVLVAGIVGVPKWLVEGVDGAPKAMSAADWEKVSGPIGKRDPHMIESIAPRAGIPRFVGDRAIDPVNGGDRDVHDGDDLQYACIAPRPAGATGAADCAPLEPYPAAKVNPLCDSSTKQPYSKAYPGLRHARILERLGSSGLIASICNESFSPIVQAIADTIRTALHEGCFRLLLSQAANGEVSCNLIEVLEGGAFAGRSCEEVGGGRCTPGAEPCRRKSDANFPPVDLAVAVVPLDLPLTVVGAGGAGRVERVQAVVEGRNAVAIGTDGKRRLVCEHKQLAGGRVDDATSLSCIRDPAFRLTSGGGFCYSTVPAIVGDACWKSGAPATLRFLGDAAPKRGSELFSTCFK